MAGWFMRRKVEVLVDKFDKTCFHKKHHNSYYGCSETISGASGDQIKYSGRYV